MRVLITGGTGFIGRPLTLGALRRGWEVVVLVRRPESAAARAIAARGARLVIGDITDDATFQAGLEVARPEVFFHNAGWYELGIPRRARRQMWATNVQATESALDLAAQTGVLRVVYTSSTTALGDTGGQTADETYQRRSPPMSYYEQTKAEAHAIARRHQAAGEPVLIVCPAQVIGPGDHSAFGRMARLFARGVLPPLGWAPEGAFTYAHVEDVAEAILLAAEHGAAGQTYFLAGEVMTLRQVTHTWSAATGRRLPFVWLPRPAALAMASVAAPLLRLAGQPAFISPEVVRSSFVSFRYRSNKAIGELGAAFRPAAQAWTETLRAGTASQRMD